ncbi:MAG: hypothetical protein NT027_16170 [Proteobacteria bacterium]|nr:hypothetical protein [Pseudomonadota bacterium]
MLSDKSDKCNVRRIVAETDARPVDGALTRLVIVDHSGDTCGGRPEFMLEVTLETSIVSRSTLGASETHSVLKGPSGLKANQQN